MVKIFNLRIKRNNVGYWVYSWDGRFWSYFRRHAAKTVTRTPSELFGDDPDTGIYFTTSRTFGPNE